MLFLTNEHIRQSLDMPTCIATMEDAYRELAHQRAAYRPRIDFYVPQEPHYYRWGTMEGASRALGTLAVRMKSDMIVWDREGKSATEEKYCVSPGTYCGLIFLFSVRDGRPLAIMNDGYLQHMRVGACAGLGAKYLAREDATSLGVIGSGGMARTYVSAISHVRPITEIRVFSPTEKNRKAFADEMTAQLGIEVKAASAPHAAARGADILVLATDSLVPVIEASWLESGMHITNVRPSEAGADVISRADIVARLGTATVPAGPKGSGTISGSSGITAYFAGSEEEARRIPRVQAREADKPGTGTIPDLIVGRWAGRTSQDQITFLDNQGTQGLQFAAIGARAYEIATSHSLGHELPDEWFLQDIRD